MMAEKTTNQKKVEKEAAAGPSVIAKIGKWLTGQKEETPTTASSLSAKDPGAGWTELNGFMRALRPLRQ